MKTDESAAVLAAPTVPWGCWDPEATLDLPFPARFQVQVNAMHDAPALSTG